MKNYVAGLFLFALGSLVSACAGMSAVPADSAGDPFAFQIASNWKTFTPQGTSGIYNGITWGPGHAVWFADYGSASTPGGIVRIDITGAYREYFVGNLNPEELTAGADGNLYFDVGRAIDRVGRITPGGSLQTFTIPSHDCICGNGLTLGRDGNVWFAEVHHVGNISPKGVITEYSTIAPGSGVGVAYGSDGRVWGATTNASIYALNPHGGAVQHYALPQGCYSKSIVAGVGNVLWFDCQGIPKRVGWITTAGAVKAYGIGQWSTSEPPHDLVAVVDGTLWFVGQATINGQLTNSINHFYPGTGTFKTYLVPQTHSNFSWDIAQDPDGNLWLSSHAAMINVFLSKL